MYRIQLAFAALLLVAVPALAQPPKDGAKDQPKPDPKVVKREVKELVEEFTAALGKTQPDKAAELLSQEFTWVVPDGTVFELGAWKQMVKDDKLQLTISAKDEIKELGVTFHSVQLTGGTTVVVGNWVIERSGRRGTVRVRFTMTLAKVETAWKIVAVQVALPRD